MSLTLSELRRAGFNARQGRLLQTLSASVGGEGPGSGELSLQHGETGAFAASMTLRSSGEGGVTDGSVDWDALTDPETGNEVTWASVGSGNITLDEGWYDVRIGIAFTFAAAAAVTYLKASFTIGNAAVGNHETFLGPVLNAAGNKVFRSLTSFGPLFSDGFAAIQPQVRWSDGVYAVSQASLQVAVTKLA